MATSGAIKGITIELGADASKFTSELKKCDKEITSTTRSLKEINNGLKFNPQNVTLLTQKAQALTQKITATKESLNTMKDALKEMDAKGVDKTSEEYQKLEREIITTESKLKNLNKELVKTQAAASPIGQLGAKFTEAGNKATELGNKLKAISAASAGVLAASVKYASDMEESVNKVAVAFGDSSSEVEKFASTTISQFGIAKGTALDMAATFGDMGTSMGLTQAQSAEMSASLVGLAGDLASFKNIGIDRATTALNGIFTGETESLKGLGVVMTQTNLDAFALANGFNKTTSQMSEAEKVQLRYAYVLNATKNAQGDFARTNDGVANQLRMLQEGVKESAAALGQSLLPIVAKVASKINVLIQAFINTSDQTKKIIAAIMGVVAASAPLLLAFGSVSKMVGSSLTSMSTLLVKLPAIGKAFAALSSPIGIVVAAIAGISAIAAMSGADLSALGNKISTFVVDAANKAAVVIPQIVQSISEHLPEIVSAAIQIIGALGKGIVQSLPILAKQAPTILKSLASGIIKSLPVLAKAGKSMLQSLANAIRNGVGSLRSVGANIVKGLWAGASNMVSWAVGKFKGLGKSILNGIKSALGIHSPSRVFRDEVGKNIVLGIAEGITDNGAVVASAMGQINGTLTTAPIAVRGGMSGTTNTTNTTNSVVFNGNYTFMNREQIEYFMKEAERLTRRRLATI